MRLEADEAAEHAGMSERILFRGQIDVMRIQSQLLLIFLPIFDDGRELMPIELSGS